jgi:hypothetical protein
MARGAATVSPNPPLVAARVPAEEVSSAKPALAMSV